MLSPARTVPIALLSETPLGIGGVSTTTTDGGLTWTNDPLPSGIEALFGVSCPTTSDCTAVDGSTVVATTSSGATWHAQTVPPNVVDLSAVSCSSSSSCTAVGRSSNTSHFIIGTSDAGQDWSPQSVPSGIDFSPDGGVPGHALCLRARGATDHQWQCCHRRHNRRGNDLVHPRASPFLLSIHLQAFPALRHPFARPSDETTSSTEGVPHSRIRVPTTSPSAIPFRCGMVPTRIRTFFFRSTNRATRVCSLSTLLCPARRRLRCSKTVSTPKPCSFCTASGGRWSSSRSISAAMMTRAVL